MGRKDVFVRVMLALLVVGVWVLILKPVVMRRAAEPGRPRRVVRAERFEVLDAAGKVRATVATTEEGAVGLDLLREDGWRGASFALTPDTPRAPGGAALTIYDQRQKTRAALDFLGGAPTLCLRDAYGVMRALVALSPDGEPIVYLRDKDEKRGIMLGLMPTVPNGEAGVSLQDSDGKVRATLGLTAAGEPRLVFRDDAEKVTKSVP